MISTEQSVIPPPKPVPVMEKSRRGHAACEAVKIMLGRDFELAKQLDVTVFHGHGRANRVLLNFSKLTFHHPDAYT
jgi:hypothetical protein